MLFFPKNDQITGIFSSIHNDFHGFEKQFVEITPSSSYWGDPYNLINNDSSNIENETTFATKQELNPNITFHLPYHKVKITHYSLKTRTDPSKAYNFLSSWVFSGSNDQKEWTILHSMGETDILKQTNVIKTFQIPKIDTFNTFRITLTNQPTDINPDGIFFLVLSGVELFGSLCDLNTNICYIPRISHNVKFINYKLVFTAFFFII